MELPDLLAELLVERFGPRSSSVETRRPALPLVAGLVDTPFLQKRRLKILTEALADAPDDEIIDPPTRSAAL